MGKLVTNLKDDVKRKKKNRDKSLNVDTEESALIEPGLASGEIDVKIEGSNKSKKKKTNQEFESNTAENGGKQSADKKNDKQSNTKKKKKKKKKEKKK